MLPLLPPVHAATTQTSSGAEADTADKSAPGTGGDVPRQLWPSQWRIVPKPTAHTSSAAGATTSRNNCVRVGFTTVVNRPPVECRTKPPVAVEFCPTAQIDPSGAAAKPVRVTPRS